jgi:hypothetical protein
MHSDDLNERKRAALFRMVAERKKHGDYVPLEELPPHDAE